jgi:transcriptional regulator with XRE-family HTH domain
VDFIDIVNAELQRRRRVNPRFSLRAFARQLRVDHSALSQLLRRRRRLTSRVVEELGAGLRLEQSVIDGACAAEDDTAVLAVVPAPGFRPDSRWIASKLGIRVDRVNMSLTRLLCSGRLVMASRKEWKANG